MFMAWILDTPIGRVVKGFLNNTADIIALTKKRKSLVVRDLVEYAHLENFKDIVDLSQNPQDYEGFSVKNYIDFNDETQKIILTAIWDGNHPEIAARAAGINPAKLRKWIQLGEQGIEPFSGFFTECLKAQGISSMEQMKLALHGDKVQSSAARWWLSVTHPDIYGKKETVKETTTTTVGMINFLEVNPEDRKRMLEEAKSSFSPSSLNYLKSNVIDAN